MKDLEDEARRIAQSLQHPEKDLTDHQDRFLARMLQTTLSLHQKDEGKEERVSHSAKEIFTEQEPVAPGALSLDPDTFYRLRRKAFEGNFPESYRGSVKTYFDSLGVRYLKK